MTTPQNKKAEELRRRYGGNIKYVIKLVEAGRDIDSGKVLFGTKYTYYNEHYTSGIKDILLEEVYLNEAQEIAKFIT